MGLFSFASNQPQYSDKVWKSSDFCLKGMMTDALRLITEGKIPVLIPQFKESENIICEFLSTKEVPHQLLDGETYLDEQDSNKVYVLSVAFLKSITVSKFILFLANKNSVHLLFHGHYPLPSKEKKIIEKFAASKNLTITFYSSLDQPSFEAFGTTNIISLMNTLGMKDDEAIEHNLVKKAMERAREKVEASVKFDHESDSEKEWFRKNLPNTN
ncbi:MAG TPA: hypothetical protein DGG95_13780 [Cytophagales bacterium]|jgi:hypothetical protein|nr:hypothetical protein [Cytophagales bacterium]